MIIRLMWSLVFIKLVFLKHNMKHRIPVLAFRPLNFFKYFFLKVFLLYFWYINYKFWNKSICMKPQVPFKQQCRQNSKILRKLTQIAVNLLTQIAEKNLRNFP